MYSFGDDGKKTKNLIIGMGVLGVLILLAVLASEEDEENDSPFISGGKTILEDAQFASFLSPNSEESCSGEARRGKVWRQEYPQVRSARQAAEESLRKISALLGERVKPLGGAAVGDKQDQDFLMMFEGREEGEVVHGLLRVSVDQGSAYATAAWAKPGQDLSTLMSQNLPSEVGRARQRPSAPPPVRWQNVALPDGTGSIRLPEGWRIISVNTPQQGALSAEGPQGGIEFGYAMQLLTPQAAAMSMMPLPDTFPMAPYSNPEQAIADVFQIIGRINQRTGQPPIQWGKVLKSEEAPATLGGQAAFIHHSWKRFMGGQWQPMESLAYVNIAPVGAGTWMFYSSNVCAPASEFRQNLGVLLEIWGSWRVSDRVHQSRLAKALQTQQETFALHQQSYQYQQQVSDRVWKAWSEVNRGLQAVWDRDRNEVGHLDLRWADDVVRIANEKEGQERWIKVDPFRLNYD